jgi:hypothetical protein
MRRKELYAQIVKLNLQNKVKEKYGVNYTNCKNEELITVIDAVKNTNKAKKPVNTAKVNKVCCADDKFTTLVHILKERHLLLPSDVEKIMNA